MASEPPTINQPASKPPAPHRRRCSLTTLTSHYTISFLTDDIIRLRYVEIDGQIRKVIVVVKMRGGNHGNHSKDIREYVINDKGLEIIDPRGTDYLQLTTGIPQRIGQVPSETPPEPKARSSAKR